MGEAPLRAPVQERAHRTRAALLEAAEREFSERGYAQTTAKSVAERAGVATGSFYQYFADKDAALRELARARLAQLATRVGAVESASPHNGSRPTLDQAVLAIRTIVAEVLDYHRGDRGLHAVLTERRHADPEPAAITEDAERGFVQQIEAGLGRWGFAGDRKAQAFLIFGLIEGSIHSHVLGTRMLSDRRFLDALTHAVVMLVRAEANQ